MKCDIVLANIPRTDPRAPYLGTFLLKSIVQNNGFTCKSFDWNRDLHDKTKNNKIFDRSDLYFNLKEKFDILWNDDLEDICHGWIKELQECNPDWFGITFMSQRQVHMGRKLVELVREKLPNTKIVVGGFFVASKPFKVGADLKKEGLIDYYINGEGEDAIVELLKGNDALQGINTEISTIPPDINLNPTPDFSDVLHYDYSRYYIYNSRGCVNKCKFCNENEYSKGYRFRKGELVCRDLIETKKATGINQFFFVDSLINGNPKEFRKLVKLLHGHNIEWSGQFLCNGWMKEEEYRDAKESGLKGFSMGIESASYRIRKEMGKGFTNEHLNQTIKYATESGMYIDIMLIVGWPTETEDDFLETLDFIEKISKIKNIRVNPGLTLRLNRQMNLYKDLKMTTDPGGKWIYKDNVYKLRKDRWLRLVEHCKLVGIEVEERQREKVEENYNDIQ